GRGRGLRLHRRHLWAEDEGPQRELGTHRSGLAFDADEAEAADVDDARQAAHSGEEGAQLMVAALTRHRDRHLGHVLSVDRRLGSEEGQLQARLRRDVGQLPVEPRHFLLRWESLLGGVEPVAEGFSLTSEWPEVGLIGPRPTDVRLERLALSTEPRALCD